MAKHWTEKLFLENPSLYQPALETIVERASGDVAGLVAIFSQYQVPQTGVLLDLCCGIGRHSVALAERGYEVIGVDLAPQFVARAKEIAAERHVSNRVKFIVGDMRGILQILPDYVARFNAVINLYTSLGYYDDTTDRAILIQLSELTASDGVLVIDVANRDWLIKHFQTRDFQQRSDDSVVIVERKLNLETSRMENIWTYYQKREQDLQCVETVELNHRVYSLHELKELIEASGWLFQNSYGDFTLSPFTMNSKRIILTAKKP